MSDGSSTVVKPQVASSCFALVDAHRMHVFRAGDKSKQKLVFLSGFRASLEAVVSGREATEYPL